MTAKLRMLGDQAVPACEGQGLRATGGSRVAVLSPGGQRRSPAGAACGAFCPGGPGATSRPHPRPTGRRERTLPGAGGHPHTPGCPPGHGGGGCRLGMPCVGTPAGSAGRSCSIPRKEAGAGSQSPMEGSPSLGTPVTTLCSSADVHGASVGQGTWCSQNNGGKPTPRPPGTPQVTGKVEGDV